MLLSIVFTVTTADRTSRYLSGMRRASCERHAQIRLSSERAPNPICTRFDAFESCHCDRLTWRPCTSCGGTGIPTLPLDGSSIKDRHAANLRFDYGAYKRMAALKACALA
eukprot:6173868-Pleurochrysis_carterae.AAC.3